MAQVIAQPSSLWMLMIFIDAVIALFTLCFPFLNELLYLFEIDQQIVRLGRGQRLALSTMPLPSASATAS
jgi:hypothetical protein